MSKCMDPILRYTMGKTRLFRHFSLASPIFKLQHDLVFDCGKCRFCRKKKAYELAARCVLHSSLYANNCFLTLTYDEKKPGYHNNFDYTDIQKFKKRLRRKSKEKIDIFNVHEYGKNGKKHWHLVVFNYDFPDKEIHSRGPIHHLYRSGLLAKLWPYGHSSIGSVTEASAMYQAQYTQKDFRNGNANNKRKSHSKHSGIGKPYFLKHFDQILGLGYVPVNGKKLPLPRYFFKLAHKHWSHFNEPINFFDTTERKALYRPFKTGEENVAISNKFSQYLEIRSEKIAQMKTDWDLFISENAFSNLKPDFWLSGENYDHDLKNKQALKDF